jgi:WD40 repeat protein
MIVATFGSEIYKIKLARKPDGGFSCSAIKQLLAGHYSPNGSWTNEVWGLDIDPKNPDVYATVSDDSTLRVWSISGKK